MDEEDRHNRAVLQRAAEGLADDPVVKRRCAKCRYWIEPPRPGERGQCRRYPPVVAGIAWGFPMTGAEEWCGECSSGQAILQLVPMRYV